MLYTPLKAMGNNFNGVITSLMAVERVFELADAAPNITDKLETIKLGKVETIEYENVSFGYTREKLVLKNVNFKINAGETIALVGNSGGGKTTIGSLLPRFYDVTSGSIKINNIDIRDIALSSLREHIAVVFQDNFLFSGTIRENIILDKKDVSEEQLNLIIKSACLDEFISTLKDGLDSHIGERGVLISGGQKQRIAIARAFLKNAPIVILDEATSALDNKSEAVVQKAIDNLMQNRTVIVIAHRLSTVRNADKIIVINHGEIAETGTHDELIDKKDGFYKALYSSSQLK
jgi:subfamily B ATP-binding cassette protein MsbA